MRKNLNFKAQNEQNLKPQTSNCENNQILINFDKIEQIKIWKKWWNFIQNLIENLIKNFIQNFFWSNQRQIVPNRNLNYKSDDSWPILEFPANLQQKPNRSDYSKCDKNRDFFPVCPRIRPGNFDRQSK